MALLTEAFQNYSEILNPNKKKDKKVKKEKKDKKENKFKGESPYSLQYLSEDIYDNTNYYPYQESNKMTSQKKAMRTITDEQWKEYQELQQMRHTMITHKQEITPTIQYQTNETDIIFYILLGGFLLCLIDRFFKYGQQYK